MHIPLFDAVLRTTYPGELDIVLTKDHLITGHLKEIYQLTEFFNQLEGSEGKRRVYMDKTPAHLMYRLLEIFCSGSKQYFSKCPFSGAGPGACLPFQADVAMIIGSSGWWSHVAKWATFKKIGDPASSRYAPGALRLRDLSIWLRPSWRALAMIRIGPYDDHEK